MASLKQLAGTLGGLEKSLKTAKGQGLNTSEIDAKKADVVKKMKELKTQASGGETELFESNSNKKRKGNNAPVRFPDDQRIIPPDA